MAAAERLPSPSLPESPVVPSGAPLPLGLSAELPSRPLRSPCAPALSLFVCLARFLLSSLGSFSLCGFAAGAVWVHTCHFSLCPVFPHSVPKATPAVWRPASPVPEVLGGRTVPNSFWSSPPVAEEQGRRGQPGLAALLSQGASARAALALRSSGKCGRDCRFLPSPYQHVTSEGFRDGIQLFLVKCLGNPILTWNCS